MNFGGVPVEADDTLTTETFSKYLRALNDALAKMSRSGERLDRVRIWKGRLVAVSDHGRGYTYLALAPPCPNCPKKEAETV